MSHRIRGLAVKAVPALFALAAAAAFAAPVANAAPDPPIVRKAGPVLACDASPKCALGPPPLVVGRP